ncbi:MAG TPA: deoxyribose-phosphate aldolase [Bacteroidales bacterium]|jgi:deoxyribose-phosphate aldolase|nr:deoxyribose-phosphate aldolase [Bacteroidales bacterium]HRS18232.1 deoxyribose-phosphate aldolase [Bacteroidales bacterium]
MNYSKYIDHSLLHPTATHNDIAKLCREAIEFDVAAVCIQPIYIQFAQTLLQHTPISVATVIGFPHGTNSIETKCFETKLAIKHGATEIDAVICIPQVIAQEWKYIETEIHELSTICKQHNICLKIIFETTYLNEYHIIKLCEICSKEHVSFVKTSTGFDFIKHESGLYTTKGAQISHIQLMKKHCFNNTQIKASGGIRSASYFIECIEAGATRIGTSATKDILKALP